MYSILIFHGTVRRNQQTDRVTKFIAEVAGANKDIEVEIVDPREMKVDFSDEGQSAAPKELTEKVEKADGYVIVAPEYNHAYPGSLKYVLDMHLKQYIHKPVALVGVSAGPFGGTRVVESLVNVVRELGMVVTFSDLNVFDVHNEFGEGGVKDKDKWERRVNKMLGELLWMMEVLKYGRMNVASEYHGR